MQVCQRNFQCRRMVPTPQALLCKWCYVKYGYDTDNNMQFDSEPYPWWLISALKPWNKADDPCWLANFWNDIGAATVCSNIALAQANILLSLCWMFILLYWMTIRCRFRSSKTLVVIKRFLFCTSSLLVNWLNRTHKVWWAVHLASQDAGHDRCKSRQHWLTGEPWPSVLSYKMLCPFCIILRLRCQNRGMLAKHDGVRCNYMLQRHLG